MMYLNLGKFAKGWPLYDYRRGAEAPDIHEQIGPPWNGSALEEGSTLWVWSEQGLGDRILHAGMVDELRTLSPWTVLEVEPRLVDLFARSFPGMGVVPLDAQSVQRKVDAQTAIGNLAPAPEAQLAKFSKARPRLSGRRPVAHGGVTVSTGRRPT